MDEEDDIGLTNLSSRSFGTAMHTPPRRSRPSLIKISRHSSTHSPLKSPSSPSLSKDFQSGAASSRRLSRSNTLPKLATEHGEFSLETFGLENLAMGNDKVVKLRRWIHALAIGLFIWHYSLCIHVDQRPYDVIQSISIWSMDRRSQNYTLR